MFCVIKNIDEYFLKMMKTYSIESSLLSLLSSLSGIIIFFFDVPLFIFFLFSVFSSFYLFFIFTLFQINWCLIFIIFIFLFYKQNQLLTLPSKTKESPFCLLFLCLETICWFNYNLYNLVFRYFAVLNWLLINIFRIILLNFFQKIHTFK